MFEPTSAGVQENCNDPTQWQGGAVPTSSDTAGIGTSASGLSDIALVLGLAEAAGIDLVGAGAINTFGTLIVAGDIIGTPVGGNSGPIETFDTLEAGTIFGVVIAGADLLDAAISGGTLDNTLRGMTVTGALSGVVVDGAVDLTLEGGADTATIVEGIGRLDLPTMAAMNAFAATLGPWSSSSHIDLGSVAFQPGVTQAGLSTDGETLTVTNAGSVVTSFHFAGSEAGTRFSTQSDGAGGTMIVVPLVTLVPGGGAHLDWNDPSIWSAGYVPGNTDPVLVASESVDTITVQGSATSGDLDVALYYYDFGPVPGTIVIASASELSVDGTFTLDHGQVELQGGTLETGEFVGGVTVIADGGGFTDVLPTSTISGYGTVIGSVTGDGGVAPVILNDAGTLVFEEPILAASILADGSIALDGSVAPDVGLNLGGGVISFGTGVMGEGTIGSFEPGSKIDLIGAAWHAGTTTAILSDHTLTVSDSGAIYGTFLVDPEFDPVAFSITDDLHGGTYIEATAIACYCRGTMILTQAGEVAVEDLRIGDGVTTHGGTIRRIKWIGTRTYDARFLAKDSELLPIRVRAGALGDNVPHRDLLVSPHHAMFLNGVLVPAEKLVNGVSVLRERDMERVEYFHVELDTHDVLIAEGAAAESFADCDSRGMFQNAANFAARYPDDAMPRWQRCAPVVEDGAILARIRDTIAARAGITAVHGTLAGQVDCVTLNHVAGWAYDLASPARPVELLLDIDGAATMTLADRSRADLAGRGAPRCGFDVALPPLARDAPHLIRIRRAADGAELPGSPVLLPALHCTDVRAVEPGYLLGEAARLGPSAGSARASAGQCRHGA